MQGESADIQKKNVIKDLESSKFEFLSVKDFLAKLKKEFDREDNKSIKIAELKKIEQGLRIIEEFV